METERICSKSSASDFLGSCQSELRFKRPETVSWQCKIELIFHGCPLFVGKLF